MTAVESGVSPRQTKLIGLRDRLQEIDDEILGLCEKDTLSEQEEDRYQDLIAERAPVADEYKKLEDRAERSEEIQKAKYRELKGVPEVRRPVDDLLARDVGSLSFREARDGALRAIGDREQNYPMSAAQVDALDRQARRDTDLARRILVTENDYYRSAFHKLMTRPHAVLTPEEHQAMMRHDEYRQQSVGTTTEGGFAVPVFIDPSVILTDQETDNPFLRIARQIPVTTNAWKGVSAAGVEWSFDAEAEEVSDDSIEIAQPTVDVEMARGFIPYSIEIGEDWPGFQAEMGRLLAEGYDELLIDKFSTGNGSASNEPVGLLTALADNTNAQVISSTSGGFFVDDVHKLWKELPQKYRRRASWMMSVDFNNRIRALGDDNFHPRTVDLTAAAADVVMGRPVFENPYFPDFQDTTGAVNMIAVGDFSNYVVARRSGMNVELVPHLFGSTARRPTGQRGWFAYARIGGNSVNDIGFRLLVNKTS